MASKVTRTVRRWLGVIPNDDRCNDQEMYEESQDYGDQYGSTGSDKPFIGVEAYLPMIRCVSAIRAASAHCVDSGEGTIDNLFEVLGNSNLSHDNPSVTMSRHNDFLDRGSDESGEENEYDSEADISRTERRGVKRRKLSYSSASSDEDTEQAEPSVFNNRDDIAPDPELDATNSVNQDDGEDAVDQEIDYQVKSASSALPKYSKKQKKEKTPGVVYLSSLPPYLKPSALCNLLRQRGFEPITRLFLTPASKHKHSSKKSSRQLYSEGWIEFANKKTAKRCADALNAQLVGGRKGGFYYDDLWNMKYLKGMAWDELMSGIREERREQEGRRDEERRKIANETRSYIEGVEQGKRLEGMKKKRKLKKSVGAADDDVQRVWRQHEVAQDRKERPKSAPQFDPEVQSVLSKII